MKKIQKQLGTIFLIAIALLYGQQILAQTLAASQCQGACPSPISASAARNARLVIHHVYAAGLNSDTGLADWVAYRITRDSVGVASLLSRSWRPDRLVDIPSELEILESEAAQVSLASIRQRENPYGGMTPAAPELGDRARLAPITSFANTPYWSDLNNLTNMVPMASTLRLGAWLRLEQAVNTMAVREGELYVVSGPLFLMTEPLSSTSANLGFKPAAYFKIVLNATGYAAFVFPESLSQHESFCDQRAPLQQIEQMSGLVLTPGIKPQESVELVTGLGCDLSSPNSF